MSRRRATVLRVGLTFFAAVTLGQGLFIVVAPETFYSWLWVNMGMPYNPHLLLDFAVMNLALAVPLAAAAITGHRLFVRTVAAAYAVWAIGHLVIHLRFRAHFVQHASAGQAAALIGLLGAAAVLAVALFALSVWPTRDPRPAR